MKNRACFFELSPHVKDSLERTERRATSLGRALEIEIRDRWEKHHHKDRALTVYLEDATTPERRIFAAIPCRRSELATLATALYLLADALAPDGNAPRALGLA